MSESRSYSTSDASENPERIEVILSLPTVQKMLPLVRHIAADILAQHSAVERMQPEEARLDRRKRELDWPGRQRRYQIKEELAADARLQAARRVARTSRASTTAGLAFRRWSTIAGIFSWHPGEDALHSWQFADEDVQRPIPAAWFKEITVEANS